jgi:predicted AAA+ superfamily ATPase
VPNFQDLHRAIQDASQSYSQLALVVGPRNSGKTALLKEYSEESGLLIINVNLYVTERLLDLNRRQRKTQVTNVMSELTNGPDAPVLLDNTEILFDPSLAIDPLRMLYQASRNKLVVSTWSGNFIDGRLTYASPSHVEFTSYDQIDAVILNMEAL